jgi:decaprenylphospho-beta-D-erythro-pentofuranosid-2-ulose 2-reductase
MNVLIVGATSAIAEAAARIWAARGDALYLAARREPLLEACAADLRLRGARLVAHERFDATDRASHAALIERATAAMAGLDVVLVAHGTLPDQAACESDVAAALAEIELNALATTSIALHAANRLEALGGGTLAVITSVAGVRGRQGNYVYGSAKAQVSTLLSGLRQRLAKKGVAVVDIRPGFVDTPMTASFSKGALWAQPGKVARDIVRAIDRGTPVAYTPWFWRWIMLVIRHIPQAIFNRIKL